MITGAGAEVAGVVIGLDRQERGAGERSAIQEVEQAYSVPVLSIIDMGHIIDYLQSSGDDSQGVLASMRSYRESYGV